MNFLEIIFILFCKRISIWQKKLKVFWRVSLNIICWILLWMLTSSVIWNLNITVSITLKYFYKKALNKKVKLMEGTMKYFPKNYWPMKYSGLWSPGLRMFFWKIFKTLRSPLSPYILNARFLMLYRALIMKIRLCLLIRNWREIYLIKYLHNRNNHSFRYSIATCVLIT